MKPSPAIAPNGAQPAPEKAGFPCEGTIWIVNVHMPHYSENCVPMGKIIADALSDGSKITGCDATAIPTIIMGDFNEFGECAPIGHLNEGAPRCHGNFIQAVDIMAPLWHYF